MWLLGLISCAQDKNTNEEATSEEILEEGSVQWIAVGDAGTGDEHQYAVAQAIEAVCEQRGCDFALYLGDNFYETGVEGIDDTQFQDKFEMPYANLDMPFWSVLGNHDYGQLGMAWEVPNAQVLYSDISEKWVMPDRYHSQRMAHVTFVGIDSNAILWDSLWGGASEQGEWVQKQLDEANTLWKIGFGHHPYLSNGQHGNAGNYDGLPSESPAAGTSFQYFVEEHFCGEVDVYFSGHDHDLQWLEPQCGTEFIVSGAGGKTRSRYDWEVPTIFETYDTYGFAWVEIHNRVMTVAFYDDGGALLYEGSIEK